MIIEDVRILDDWAREGHRVIVVGRPGPGAPRSYLKADGTWMPVSELHHLAAGEDRGVGFTLPEGALDAICAKYLGVAAPTPASERHLRDALTVRDRLLTLVEKEMDS